MKIFGVNITRVESVHAESDESDGCSIGTIANPDGTCAPIEGGPSFWLDSFPGLQTLFWKFQQGYDPSQLGRESVDGVEDAGVANAACNYSGEVAQFDDAFAGWLQQVCNAAMIHRKRGYCPEGWLRYKDGGPNECYFGAEGQPCQDENDQQGAYDSSGNCILNPCPEGQERDQYGECMPIISGGTPGGGTPGGGTPGGGTPGGGGKKPPKEDKPIVACPEGYIEGAGGKCVPKTTPDKPAGTKEEKKSNTGLILAGVALAGVATYMVVSSDDDKPAKKPEPARKNNPTHGKKGKKGKKGDKDMPRWAKNPISVLPKMF